jgi:Rrf2 family iron-sulfur cluster assembly transcriptional regulator
MLSNTSKYAIRAMIYLALKTNGQQKIGIKKISADLNIPSPFLAKILQVLAKHKLLTSTKGPNGGFGLAKDSKRITLFEIITVIDGNDIFDKCLISMRSCHEEDIPCPLHEGYKPIRDAILKLFKEKVISDLAYEINTQKKIIAL